MYLVKELDNAVIFPHESTGRFFSSIDAIYDVYGTDAPDKSSFGSPSLAPFGSYTRYAASNHPPHPSPFVCQKKRLVKKSIVLGSLSLREQGPSSRNRIQYSVVTQLTVTLDPAIGQCSIEGVCKKVKEQVGFDPILLDSKCYPLLANDDTTSPDFWKSTRKIIAAPAKIYEKLGGVAADTDRGGGGGGGAHASGCQATLYSIWTLRTCQECRYTIQRVCINCGLTAPWGCQEWTRLSPPERVWLCETRNSLDKCPGSASSVLAALGRHSPGPSTFEIS